MKILFAKKNSVRLQIRNCTLQHFFLNIFFGVSLEEEISEEVRVILHKITSLSYKVIDFNFFLILNFQIPQCVL